VDLARISGSGKSSGKNTCGNRWQGYFPDCLDFEEKVARWMSVVEHRFLV